MSAEAQRRLILHMSVSLDGFVAHRRSPRPRMTNRLRTPLEIVGGPASELSRRGSANPTIDADVTTLRRVDIRMCEASPPGRPLSPHVPVAEGVRKPDGGRALRRYRSVTAPKRHSAASVPHDRRNQFLHVQQVLGRESRTRTSDAMTGGAR
jgi:hypothetical protein